MTKKEPERNRKVYNRSATSGPPKPQVPLAPSDDVWQLIDDLIAANPDQPPAQLDPSKEQKKRPRGLARRRRRRIRWRRTVDVIGTVFWSFAVTKLFIGDLDRVLVNAFLPSLLWVLDLRWLLVLVLLALLLLLFKSRRLGFSLAYVLAFPLVLVLWKLPKYLIRKRSSLLVIALVGMAMNLGSRLRLFLIALAIACLSGFMISLGEPVFVMTGVASMGLTLLWWLTASVADLLRSTAFIRSQASLVKSLLESRLIERLPSPQLPDRIAIQSWTIDDAKQFRDNAGYGVLVTRLLQFWAACVEQYRQGPSAVLLNILAAMGLSLQVILAFTFIHYGIYLLDPTQFMTGSANPDLLTFAYYSATATFFGEIGILTPLTGLAIAAKITNGLVGVIVLGTVVFSIVMTYRGTKGDADTAKTVQALTSKADQLSSEAIERHQMNLAELEDRLFTTSWAFIGVARWLRAYSENALGASIKTRTRS